MNKATRAARATQTADHLRGTVRTRATASLLVLGFLVSILLLLEGSGVALAGKAAAGELFFYPCTKCHPVGGTPAAARPNRFEKHQIKLEIHDKLGRGKAACLVCHDDPNSNPGMLKLIDGSLVDITGDVSRVCYRCHEDKYKEWKAGVHGKEPRCTTAGCHDPHTPGWIAIDPLLPFLGTSIQVQVLPERKAFTALPPPSSPPPVETPLWLKLMALAGVVLAGGILGGVVLERSKP